MPGLQFQELPAAQVNEVKDRLRSQWQIEANALNKSWFSDRGKFETAKAKLNAKYQRLEFDSLSQLQQQQQEQERVQQLIKQPRKMGRAEEAGLRMELRPEAERLVFLEPAQPFSMSYLYSKTMMESIDYFAEAAPDAPGLEWGPPKKTKQGLINQYLQWRELQNYAVIKDARKRRQLDQRWDISMAEDPKYDKWWYDKKNRKPMFEIRTLRTPGDIGKTMRDRILGAGGVTPMGASIGKAKSRGQKRSEQRQLPSPTTQAEYNKLPSGTQYMGSDGLIRTKR